MFSVGDFVSHKVYGVCKVENVSAQQELSGIKDKLYYSLAPIYESESTLYVPVEKEAGKLRRVLNKTEVLEAIDNMDNAEVIWIEDERQREKIYKDALERAGFNDWISVVKTIYQRKKLRDEKGKKLTSVDGRYIKIAEGLLNGEAAFALNINRDDVKSFIMERKAAE